MASAALNSERLLSARLRYLPFAYSVSFAQLGIQVHFQAAHDFYLSSLSASLLLSVIQVLIISKT